MAANYVSRHLFSTFATIVGLVLALVLIAFVLVGVLASNGAQDQSRGAQDQAKLNQAILCHIELRQWQVYNLKKPFPTQLPVDACGLSVAAFDQLLRDNPTPKPRP